MTLGRSHAAILVYGTVVSLSIRPRPALADPAADESIETCASAAERGQVARKDADLLRARGEFSACAVDTCPRIVREDCRRWLSEIETELEPLGAALPSSPSQAPAATATAAEGDTKSPVNASGPPSASGERARASGTGAPPRAGAAGPQDAGLRGPTADPKLGSAVARIEKPAAASMTWAYVFGLTSVATLGGFAYFELQGQSRYRDLEDGCGRTQSCSEDQVSAARTDFVAAGSLVAASAVCLGLATWQFLRSKGAPSAVRFTPGGHGNRGAAGAVWRF